MVAHLLNAKKTARGISILLIQHLIKTPKGFRVSIYITKLPIRCIFSIVLLMITIIIALR